jgi:hypothetical protein
VCFASAIPAAATTAVLSRSGTLYEVYRATYGDLAPATAGTAEGREPLLALRTTTPGASPAVEIVAGTLDTNDEGSESIEFDETTGTVFVVFTKFQGLRSDLHVAVRRSGGWLEQDVLPTGGLYLSLNPKVVVTRQDYVDFDGLGGTVTKSRSILSIVWWEEGGLLQARFAAVFVEDGILRLDDVISYNLNELAGAAGQTPYIPELPFSSYTFPAVQRDPASNGGVLVSFASLVTMKQTALKIGFPDDLTKLVEPGSTSGTPESYARGHIPIGRELGAGMIPSMIDVPGDTSIGALVSQRGVTTFFWSEETGLRVIRSDAAADAAPLTLPLRPDFTLDRAIAVVREMSEKD